MFKERWPIRCSPDEMQFGRPNESLSLSPWNASFQTHRKRPSSYGKALPASTRSKKKKKKHRTTVRRMRNREKKWKSTRVLRDTCSNRPDFVRVVAFDDPSFIKISISFHILDNYIISLISFNSQNLYTTSCQLISSKKQKKKRRTDIELNRLAFQSFRLSSTIERKKKREREKKREKIGGGNATSVIKTRWNTSVDAINLIISHSPISLSFPPTLPPHIYLQLSPYP